MHCCQSVKQGAAVPANAVAQPSTDGLDNWGGFKHFVTSGRIENTPELNHGTVNEAEMEDVSKKTFVKMAKSGALANLATSSNDWYEKGHARMGDSTDWYETPWSGAYAELRI
jgi:hypothetical protein